MTKICVTPNSYKNALELINNKANALLVTLKNFGNRANYYFSLSQIKELNSLKKDTQIFVSLNNFFFEYDLDSLTETLKNLQQIKVDKVFFNDYAVAQIDYELNLNLNLHYHSNTLFTSYQQFEFFNENNIYSISLPNELFLVEINKIANNKPSNTELLLQTQGFSFIMHSRWNLVSNFQKYVDDKQKEYDANKIILIKELNKVYPNLIIQDEYGTHMFTGYELCCIQYLKQLIDLKIDYLLIDTYLIKQNDYDLKMNTIYMNAINHIDSLQQYYDQIKNISKNELSAGFIGGAADLKHLLKKEK